MIGRATLAINGTASRIYARTCQPAGAVRRGAQQQRACARCQAPGCSPITRLKAREKAAYDS